MFPRFIGYIKDCETQQDSKADTKSNAAEEVIARDVADAGSKKFANQTLSGKAAAEASPKKRLDFEEGAASKVSSKAAKAKRRQAAVDDASPKKKKPVFDFTKRKVDDSDDEDEEPLLLPSLKAPPPKDDDAAPVRAENVVPARENEDCASAPLRAAEGKDAAAPASEDAPPSPSSGSNEAQNLGKLDSDEAQNLGKLDEDSKEGGPAGAGTTAAEKGDDAAIEQEGDAAEAGMETGDQETGMEIEEAGDHTADGGAVDADRLGDGEVRSEVDANVRIVGARSVKDAETTEGGRLNQEMEKGGGDAASAEPDAGRELSGDDPAVVVDKSTVMADSTANSKADSTPGLKRLRPATVEEGENSGGGKAKKKAKKELVGFSLIPFESLSDHRIKTCKRLVKVISDVDLIEQHVRRTHHHMQHPTLMDERIHFFACREQCARRDLASQSSSDSAKHPLPPPQP